MPTEAVAEVEPARAGRYEYSGDFVEDLPQRGHPACDVRLQAELPGHAVVAELEVRRRCDHSVHTRRWQLTQDGQRIPEQDGCTRRAGHFAAPCAMRAMASSKSATVNSRQASAGCRPSTSTSTAWRRSSGTNHKTRG